MRILLIATAALVGSVICSTATAQTAPTPIQTIELPPSISPPSDPFMPADAGTEAEIPAVDDGDEARPDILADAPADAPASAGRVDRIMREQFGPPAPDEREVAIGLYREQFERDRIEAERVSRLNDERRAEVEAENARRLRDHAREVERINAENERRMIEWRARVARCEAGDRTACGA